jgi:uncharacterized protein (UPF0210 family)
MKIRAITLFLQCKGWSSVVPRVTEAAQAAEALAEGFKSRGYEVQTTRIATNSFEEFLPVADGPEACEACAKELVAALDELGVDFFNLGPATTAAGRALLVPLLKLSPRLTATCVCASNTPPPTEEGAKGASSTSTRTSSSGAVFSPPGDDHTALIDEAAIDDAAGVMIRLGRETEGGYGNFRFCATFCCPPGAAFFPAAYAPSTDAPPLGEGRGIPFALGLECGDVALSALTAAAMEFDAKAWEADKGLAPGGTLGVRRLPLSLVRSAVQEGFAAALVPLEEHATAIAAEVSSSSSLSSSSTSSSGGLSVEYTGIDASLNPGLADDYSVAEAVEVALGSREGPAFGSPPAVTTPDDFEAEGSGGGEAPPPPYAFGSSGTLAVASALTSALKALPVKLTGYSGLMLPPLEDATLARRQMATGTGSGTYGVQELLAYSAVCGVGLDTVPLPGDTPRAKIAATLLDTAALAARWRKPLSARLFPVPGLKAGDMTSFDSPFLINTRVFRV